MLLSEISQNLQENTYARICFLVKLQGSNFITKETLAQVLSCEFYQISKNTFSCRTRPVAACARCMENIIELINFTFW